MITGENRDDPRANSNGSGKSMILDAIDWCLFGVHPRGDSVQAVVNDVERKNCQVTLRLEDDEGREVSVCRWRKVSGKKDGVSVVVGDEEITTHDSRETQARLESILGLDREVFHASVLFGQFDDWRFAEATDAERKALLTKMIPELDVVDGWLERVKKASRDAESRVQGLEREAIRYQVRLETFEANDPRAAQESWESERARRRGDLDAKIREWTEGIHRLDEELRVWPQVTVPAPPQSPRELGDAEVAADLARRTVVQAESRFDLLSRQVTGARESGVCPTCGQEIPGGRDDEHIARLESEVEDARREMDAARVYSEERRKVADEWRRQFEAVMAQHAQEAARALEANRHHDRLVERRELRVRELEGYRAEYGRVQAQQNPHAGAISKWEAMVRETAVDLERARGDLESGRRRLEILGWWQEALGPRGVKSHLLDSRLQEMSDEANRWVSLLTGGTTWVRFETQSRLKSGKLVDRFSVRCFSRRPDGTELERGFRSWCGGERHRIGTGIDFGLARIVARRQRHGYNALFLDEIFGKHLDAEGKQAVAEMLRELAREKSSVFVVDHDPRFQSLFDEVVHVVREGSASRIESGSGG